MLRVTVEVLPPEGERRVIETIEVENVSDPNMPGFATYVTRRRGCSLDRATFHHRLADGSLVLVRKALEALGR